MRVARLVKLTEEERETLGRWARGRSLPARLVERAKLILMAADGARDKEIAAKLKITPEKAARWRKRFAHLGLTGLEKDAPRPGRPRTISAEQVAAIVKKTTQDKPAQATHWSTRTMAEASGLSEASVRRIWHRHGLKPHLTRTFQLSRDPQPR